MPVPQSFDDIDETPANNSPQGSDPVGITANQFIQAAMAFIKQIYDGKLKPLAAIDFNAQKLTNLADGVDDQDAVTMKQLAGAGTLVSQCRLALVGANLVLSPFNGQSIVIDGAIQKIPAAGVSLAPTGTAAATWYNIYAFMSGTTLELEFATTAHTTDATTGVEVKTGDVTRSLVGAAFVTNAGAWLDTSTNRQVISWFNRAPRHCLTQSATGTILSASSGFTEVTNAMRATWINWASEDVEARMDAYTNGNGQAAQAGISFDLAAPPVPNYQNVPGSMIFVSIQANASPAEGVLHTATVMGNVGPGGGQLIFGFSTGVVGPLPAIVMRMAIGG
jgi:hypothetical protein